MDNELMWISILFFLLIWGHHFLNSSIISFHTKKDSLFSSSILVFVAFTIKWSRNLRWMMAAFCMRNFNWMYADYALNLHQFFCIVVAASTGPFSPLNILAGIRMKFPASSTFTIQSNNCSWVGLFKSSRDRSASAFPSITALGTSCSQSIFSIRWMR